MAITNVSITPRTLPVYGDAPVEKAVNPLLAYEAGTQIASNAILASDLIRSKQATLRNVAGEAEGEMALRPEELELKRKQIAAEVSDIDATAARQTRVKQAALDLKGLTLDLEKVLFPTRAAQATSEAITGANDAAVGARVSDLRVSRADSIVDAVAGDISNLQAKTALEGQQLLRLKDDPYKLKEELQKKLIEIGKPFNPEDSAETMFKLWHEGRNEEIETLTRIAEIKAGAGKTGDTTKAEGELRREYVASPVKQRYDIVSEAAAKISSTANKPDASVTAADDISTIYSFMRINDPGSTVREGEFATAQNAAGVPERIRNAYNKALKGTRLSAGQRLEIVNTSQALFDAQQKQFNRHRDMYSNIATRTGLSVDNVVGDENNASPTAATATESAPPANAQSPRKRFKLRDGRIVFGWYVKDPKTGVVSIEQDTAK